MNKKLSVLALFVLIVGTYSVVAAQNGSQPEKVEKSLCLACHGSFDDIAAATAGYKAPSGEVGTPHRYIPHAEKQDIPECVECHKPHPIPPESKDQVVKPDNIEFCYANCHHARNLQPCSACHQ
jgi:hypothetical protein